MATFSEAMSRLQALGDPRGVAVWEKMYGTMEGYLGVGVTKIKTLAKELKRNHDVALELWNTGILDAQLLAIYTEEPKKVTLEQIHSQIPQVRFADSARRYGAEVIALTPYAWDLVQDFIHHPEPMYRVCAYGIASELAERDKKCSDDVFFPFLETIEKDITTEDNWVKEAMIFALMVLGSRSAELNRKAVAVCQKTGTVIVDYGDTSCVTPDPLKHLTTPKLQEKLGIIT